MNAAINLHFRSEEQIQELQHVLADRPWWRVTIFHSSSTTNFVCDGCRHLALPHNGKLLSMKWKFEYWSSPWQIWVLAQIIHYRVIPWAQFNIHEVIEFDKFAVYFRLIFSALLQQILQANRLKTAVKKTPS